MESKRIYIENPSFFKRVFQKSSIPTELVLPSGGAYIINDFYRSKKLIIESSGSNITLDYVTLNENEVYINNPNGTITINFNYHESKYDESKIIKCEELIYNEVGVLKDDDDDSLLSGPSEELYINQPITCNQLTLKDSNLVGAKIFVDGKNIAFIDSVLIGQIIRLFGGKISFLGKKSLSQIAGSFSLKAWNSFDINAQELHLDDSKIEADEKTVLIRVDKLMMVNNSIINAVNGELDVEVVGMRVDETSDITSKPENFRLARNDMRPKPRISNIEYFEEVETCSEEIDGHSNIKLK